MRGGLHITCQIGSDALQGTLPYLPTRLALNSAFRDACGLSDDGTASPAPDGQDLVLVYAAALGLCLRSHLELPTLRAMGRDLFELGEAAYEALVAQGYTPQQVVDAGRATFLQVVQSIPQPDEVQQQRENFPSPVASSTGST